MFQESEKPHEIAQKLTFSWLFIIFLSSLATGRVRVNSSD